MLRRIASFLVLFVLCFTTTPAFAWGRGGGGGGGHGGGGYRGGGGGWTGGYRGGGGGGYYNGGYRSGGSWGGYSTWGTSPRYVNAWNYPNRIVYPAPVPMCTYRDSWGRIYQAICVARPAVVYAPPVQQYVQPAPIPQQYLADQPPVYGQPQQQVAAPAPPAAVQGTHTFGCYQARDNNFWYCDADQQKFASCTPADTTGNFVCQQQVIEYVRP